MVLGEHTHLLELHPYTKKTFIAFPGQEIWLSKLASGCRNSGNASSEPH